MYPKKTKPRKPGHDTHILFLFGSRKIFGSNRSYYWKYGLRGGGYSLSSGHGLLSRKELYIHIKRIKRFIKVMHIEFIIIIN